MPHATIGTISHGTLRIQDLVPAFLDEARRLDAPHVPEIVKDIPLSAIVDDRDPYWDTEDAFWQLEALFDSLSDVAPRGCYFGAHVGDGSDFGFWPGEEN